MEIGEEGSASMATKNKKLAIEDYLDFIKNRDHQLNNDQIRKIISVHGYRGFEVKQSMLLDAVKTINLMDLRRSTLKDNSVSGDACLTLTSVINDLHDLQWKECHVTSLITVPVAAATLPVNRKRSKGLGKKPAKIEADDSIGSITGTDVDSRSTIVKLKRLEDLENNPVEVAADDSTISTTGTTVAAGSTTVSEKGKKSKGLGKKTAEVDSTISTSSTSVPVKKKKSKGIEKKPDEDAADGSTKCTTVAAGSTTASAKRKRIGKACSSFDRYK